MIRITFTGDEVKQLREEVYVFFCHMVLINSSSSGLDIQFHPNMKNVGSLDLAED